MRYEQVAVRLTRGKWATIAEVTIGDPYGEALGVSGESRLHFGDEQDPLIGDEYAVGRALLNAGQRLIESADFRVKVADGEFDKALEVLDKVDPTPDALLDYYRGYFDDILKEA